ncbi:hypothetical protein EU546_05470 [Candidatus Thorarchaeota archaeon]|nr:MAG: hypothetical protein EU546_05470 [Candidatus Thorarchaeota archaeon]
MMSTMPLNPYEVRLLSVDELSQDTVQYFRDRYNNRFIRALRAAEEGRVVRYHFLPSDTTTWIVRGGKREYLVIPDIYCSCRSFYQSVVIAHDFEMCYHLLAQRIAEIRDLHKSTETTDSERRRLYDKWRRTD